VSNQFYMVESCSDLNTGSWTTATNNVPGIGAIVTVTDHVPAGLPKRFYRVRQLP
jgi:hypothetical protein